MKKTEKYRTPKLDALSEQRQKFVLKYCERFNKREALKYAAYSVEHNNVHIRSKALLEREDVKEAIEELILIQRAQSEDVRQAVVTRLHAQSIVSMPDLCDWHEEDKKWVIKKPEDVQEEFKGCMGMVSVSREGNALFNQGAADNAKKLLSQYMLWDKELRDDMPSLTFNFDGLKRETYQKPE